MNQKSIKNYYSKNNSKYIALFFVSILYSMLVHNYHYNLQTTYCNKDHHDLCF
jgi:hypothetical protein